MVRSLEIRNLRHLTIEKLGRMNLLVGKRFALTKTYLDHNTDLCLRFVSWLNRLVNVQ